MHTSNSMAPVQAGERIDEIDIVRGVALLGILMVNMSFFKYPVFMERIPSNFPEGIEQLSAWLIQLFFTGKFYAIFSFLFGLGFYIFMERTISKGLELKPLYKRRLAALMVFGLLHIVFFWSGDILFNYALVGFILLAFRNISMEAVKKWISGLFVLSTFFNFLTYFLKGAGEFFDPDKYQAIMDEMISSALVAYTEGTYLELTMFRLANEVPYVISGVLLWIPQVLAFFLCGLYIGKKGIFKDIPACIPLFKKVRTWGFLIGGFFLIIMVLLDRGILPLHPLFSVSLLGGINYISSLFLFPAYVASIILASQSGIGKKLLAPVAAAGKMALTNYLAQTLICVIIFYGFGFGFYGEVSLSEGILITIAIFLVQVAWSNAWLRKFKYGPMEWFWRLLTYKKRQPFMNR
ncbi:MAG: DUF418 domain-containing protein [Bacillota bacterium]